MSNPATKRLGKKVLADRDARALVRKAKKEGKIHVVVDAKPCSLEISKSTSGIIAWKVKIYSIDSQETHQSVKDIKKISEAIAKEFPV